MKKTVLFAFGAVFPLVAVAVLVIIMPPLATWVVVGGIAVVAGVFSAWAGQELCQLLWSVRAGINVGTQTMLKALEEASKETKAARNEANKVLAERLERFFKEYGQRDEAWRTQTLAEWQAVTQALGSSFEKVLSDAISHLATLAEQERALQEATAKSRAEAMLAEVKQARSEFEQLCEGTKEAMERHAVVIQATAKTLEAVEEHFAKQQANEVEVRHVALAEWRAVTQALGSSFEKHLATLAEQERALQEAAAKSRAKVIDAELAKIKETFEQVEDTRTKLNAEVKKAIEALRNLVETEAQRQQQQKRADRDHHEKMLEVQQKAHDAAAERSGQLWGQLLDRLND